jgi:hypothetical protein
MREKLNERLLCKQGEIRVREEEINVIQDLIRFIDEYQPKHLTNSSSSNSSTITTSNSTNEILQQGSNFNSKSNLLNVFFFKNV